MTSRLAILTQRLHDARTLVRDTVSLMVAASAAFGYLLERPVIDAGFAWTLTGAMLVTGGCSAWNQLQEKDLDALIPRTRNRPLVQGRVSPAFALVLGIVCFGAGTACLYAAGGLAPASLAFVVAGLYNGLYTPLKRVSGFALLAGAVVGALPPVLGWLCAGGGIFAPELALLYGVYLLWQVPHFWMRAERDSEAYAAAKLPLPPVQFSGPGYRRLLRLWFQAYAAAVLLLPVFPLLHGPAARIVLGLLGMALFVGGGLLLRPGSGTPERRYALQLTDGGLAAAMLVVVLDRLMVFG
ncbi:Protoheme IX farnesyltransferase [uncultured delta proteobacterium]|uniref:Protoheme IX farnesyltransferase n=1 Tax=uncultured delta proteobacterium TaxID=34034 RepID=A0A212IYZ2_9DELT|nr:Protoheme IX farnesyltransferase [uncultured delta proteobacterium]